MGENTLFLDIPGNEVKPIFGWDQVWAVELCNWQKKSHQKEIYDNNRKKNIIWTQFDFCQSFASSF